jgi:uncharacterized protein YoxC
VDGWLLALIIVAVAIVVLLLLAITVGRRLGKVNRSYPEPKGPDPDAADAG